MAYFKDSESSYHGVHFNKYQKVLNINNDEYQRLKLLKDIFYKNNIKDSRNSKVISQFGEKNLILERISTTNY